MMMTYKVIIFSMMLVLTALILSAGCFEEYQKPALDVISPIVVLKGSDQYCIQYPESCTTPTPNVTSTPSPTPTPTPIPTVIVEPTSDYHAIDPFASGERWQGQWYRWTWPNASGLQDANRGIIIYGHSYHSAFTQWNNGWGNYVPLLPSAGYRFLAVYVHQEDFGPDDDGLWGYQSSQFKLQYSGILHDEYLAYSKIDRIIELEDSKSDYYNIDRLKPYGVDRIFIGKGHEDTGGYYLENRYSLRTGKGNSWDGYTLYQVPVSITDTDIRIVANFAGKNVNWRFDRIDGISPVSAAPVYHTPLPTQAIPLSTPALNPKETPVGA